MSQIGWDESAPQDTESAGLGDDRIRSLKTSLRQGLAAEHTWPSAGGDSGVHLLGSARAYYGTQSAVSSSGTDGRLYQTSDTSLHFHVGSGGTSYIGGPTVISAGSFPGTTPQRHYWAEEFGISVATANGVGLITFPNSGYSGAPYVFISSLFSDIANRSDTVVTVNGMPTKTSATFLAVTPATGSGLSGSWVIWRSIGTRVL